MKIKLYFGQKQSPKPFFQDGINQAENNKCPPVMAELGTKVNLGWQHNFANFNKNNPIDGDKQESTNSKNQSFIHLILKLSKLSNRVRIRAFLN